MTTSPFRPKDYARRMERAVAQAGDAGLTGLPGGHYAVSGSAWAMHLLGLQERVPAAATAR